MSLNFVDSLEKTAEDIKRPPLLPVGTYEWQVKKYEFDKSNDGKWEMCNFHLNCTAVGEDVDPDALAEYGGTAVGAYMRYTFMFDTEDTAKFNQTLFRLKRFLVDTLKCWDESAGSLKEGIANAVNSKFNAVIRWKADKNDAEVQYTEIAKTAPLA